MNIYGIEKDGTDESLCRAGIEMQTENGLEDTAGKGGGGTS